MFWHWPPLQPASQTHLQSGECYLVVLLSNAMLRSSLQLLTSCSDTGRAGRTRGCTAAAAAGARPRPRYPRTRAPRGPPPRTPRPASRACTRSGPPRRSRGPSSRGPGSRAPGTTGPCNPANIFCSSTNITGFYSHLHTDALAVLAVSVSAAVRHLALLVPARDT